MKKKAFLLFISFILLVAMTGFANSQERDPLIVMQAGEIQGLDPQFSSSLHESNVLKSLFDTLVKYDDEMNLVGNVVTDWEMIDDYTWEFKVREGITASNGEVINAHDVVYTFERGTCPDVGAATTVPWLLSCMNFPTAEVVDDYTFRLVTEAYTPQILPFLSAWYVFPMEYYKNTSLEDAISNPVGSGPYTLVEWVRGDRKVVTAREDYWGAERDVKDIIWKVVLEPSARMAALNTGAADIIVNVPPDQVAQIDPDYGRVEIVQGLRKIYTGFVFYQHEAIQDRRVRQALNYAVDMQQIIDALLDGATQRTFTFVNEPFGQHPELEPYPHDPEKARELLAEAGYEDRTGDGFVDNPDGTRLTLRFHTPRGRYLQDYEIAQAMGGQMMNAGIYVEVTPIEWSVFSSRTRNSEHESEMFLLGSGTGYHALGDMSDFWCASGWKPGEWCDPKFEEMFAEVASRKCPDHYEEGNYMLQEYMYEEAPLIFMYMQPDFWGASNRIEWAPAANERVYTEYIKWTD